MHGIHTDNNRIAVALAALLICNQPLERVTPSLLCNACNRPFRYALKNLARPRLSGGGVPRLLGARRREKYQVSGPVRSDRRPARQQLTGVFENNNSVAEQAPALVRVTC
jgi:hypothetical protein